MLRYVIAIALALPIAAQAEVTADQQRMHECGMEGLVFQMAATFRDSGWSAQYSYDYLRKARYDGVDDAFIKKAVNLVFFDEHFAYARGAMLAQQVIQACYQPSQSRPVE
jgi:hypothetical protein